MTLKVADMAYLRTYDCLYKFDTRGKVRVWWMEQHGSRHRTVAGIHEGNLVTSEWTQCEATNVGRSNERDPAAQAAFEIEAEYTKKLAREYHDSIESSKGGAHYFKPMLAQKYEKFAPGFAQPKLDGIRNIAKYDGLWSREGKPIMGAPHIFEALKPLFDAEPELVFDGELYNHDYKEDFNTIISVVRKKAPDADQLAESIKVIQYHVYDLPSANGPFSHRLQHLTARLQGMEPDGIHIVPTYRADSEDEYDNLHGRWLEEGYEGSIHRLDAPYEQKRSKHLRKRKEFQDAEFEVLRIEEGLGNWAGVAKRVVCRLPDGREFGAGIKGSRERAAELLHEKHGIATIQYFAMTPDGVPRFPVAVKFHGEAREL